MLADAASASLDEMPLSSMSRSISSQINTIGIRAFIVINYVIKRI